MKAFRSYITEVKVFKYYYHVTLASNVKKIQAKGIVPFQPSNWVKGDGSRYNQDYAGVYAFSHPEDAFKWAFKMNWDFKKPTSIVRIKRGSSWRRDPSDDIHLKMGKGKALMSAKAIPSSDIIDSFPLDYFDKPLDFDKITQQLSESKTTKSRLKVGDLVMQDDGPGRASPIYQVVIAPDEIGNFSGVRFIKSKGVFSKTRTSLSTRWKSLKKVSDSIIKPGKK